MTPVQTSLKIIERIEKLNKDKKRIKPFRFFRKTKMKDINERLQLNWKWLYEFYPEYSNISNITTFKDLVVTGHLPNMIRFAVYGEDAYVVGSKEWSDHVKEFHNPFKDLIGGVV